MGVSMPTLSRVTRDLVATGMFAEGESRSDAESRRPSRPLDVVPDSRHFIGVRLTEASVQGVLATLRAGVVDAVDRPLPAGDVASVVDAVVATVHELQSFDGVVTGVGVSVGGSVDHEGVVTQAPFFDWGAPVALGEMLSDRLGVPVAVDNDVTALARFHAWFGPHDESPDFCLLTLGIATGYALVLGGEVVEGPEAGLGVLGHLPLSSSGPICPEGHRGCAHSLLSTAGIAGSVSVACGRTVDVDGALEMARGGHPGANRTVEDSIRALGRLIAVVTSATFTRRVLIAGEAAGLARHDVTLLAEAVAQGRPQGSAPVGIDVGEPTFLPWACGAATAMIRRYVLGPP